MLSRIFSEFFTAIAGIFIKPETLFLFFLLWTSFLRGQSSQNFEEKIYNIYKSSYSREISDDLWNQYVSNAGTSSYEVAEGDTLWSLSEVFFGNGHYWSKIWSYNEKLTNPHLILVGQNISFFTGSVEKPPTLTIEDNGEEGGQSKENQDSLPGEQITGIPQISIPPPREKIAPIRPIPPVFGDKGKYNIEKFDGEKIKMDMHASIDHIFSIFVEAFIYDENVKDYPKKIGRVLESEESKSLLGLNDVIYIESEENLNIGEELTVMDKNYVIKGLIMSFGSVINYLGRIKIINDLGDKRYRAEVFQSFGEIKRGAWVSRENIPSFSNDYNGEYSDVELDIIGGGASSKITIFSQNDVIFLNGGSEQGLKKGDILGVYSKRNKRYGDTFLKMSPDPIAHVKIFDTGKKVASAFVLDSSEAILVGDKTGNPVFMAKSDSKNNFSKDIGIEDSKAEDSGTKDPTEDLGIESPEAGDSQAEDLGTEAPVDDSGIKDPTNDSTEDLGVEPPAEGSETKGSEEDLGIESPEVE